MYGERLSTAHATVYHKTILDIGCPEILLQVDTFHVRIGGEVVELWCQKRVAVREPERTWVTSSSFQNSHRGSSSVTDTEPKNKCERKLH